MNMRCLFVTENLAKYRESCIVLCTMQVPIVFAYSAAEAVLHLGRFQYDVIVICAETFGAEHRRLIAAAADRNCRMVALTKSGRLCNALKDAGVAEAIVLPDVEGRLPFTIRNLLPLPGGSRPS